MITGRRNARTALDPSADPPGTPNSPLPATEDEGDDRAARDLLRILVNLERSRCCAEQAAEFSAADARRYRERAADWQKQLAPFA
jgi:hypothetical protein